MKIAFLSWYSGIQYRGVETFVHEIGNRLLGLGHDVVVFQGGDKLSNSKYRVEKLKNEHLLPNLDNTFDVIVPLNGDVQVWLSRLWAIRNHKKCVVTGQSGPGLGDRIKILSFPDVFVALSDYQMGWARSRNPFVKKVKISNGVDVNRFKPTGQKISLGLPGTLVINVGALDELKRPELTIEAVAKTQCSLLLVGKGTRELELQKMGDRLMPGRFAIKAYTYDQMPAVYRSADLLAFSTSPWESFGMVILEAMASGLPVVVPDDPIRKEIVGSAGLTVDVTNKVEFSARISEALTQKWGETPRSWAEKFSWDNVAQKYDELFKTL